jgi:hypothetical protein
MKPLKTVLVVSCISALVMLACGISFDLGTTPSPSAPQQPSSQDQISTMVAQTVQAFRQAEPSATPTSTATPTNVPAPPTLSVSVATNCYAGPRTNYGFVITIRPGTIVTVVGKDIADNYWIIAVPNYPGTVCWLSGQYASVSGETGNLSSPATPALSNYNLSEPRNLHVSCTSESLSGTPEPWWHNGSEWSVDFRWTNTDPDQTGVRVYRNGRLRATLGGHASSYNETFFHEGRHGVTYGVQAFSSTEVSSIVTLDVNHCR